MNLGDQPAFPVSSTSQQSPGMTIRVWLAGLAMQGRVVDEEGSFQSRAKWAVQMADAVLAELEKDKSA